MSLVWVDVLEGEDLKHHRTALINELAQTIDLWHPYKTLDQIIDDIDNELVQVWIGGINREICIWGLTDLVTYTSCRAIRILWCSGKEGPRFFELWTKKVEQLAEVVGADMVEIRGRAGWQRIFAQHGYDVKYVTLVKEVGHARRRIAGCETNERSQALRGAEEVDGSGDGSGQPDPIWGDAPTSRSSGI